MHSMNSSNKQQTNKSIQIIGIPACERQNLGIDLSATNSPLNETSAIDPQKK